MKSKLRDADGLHRRPNKPGAIWYFRYPASDGRLREKSTGTASFAESKIVRDRFLTELREHRAPTALASWRLDRALDYYIDHRAGVAPTTLRNDKVQARALKNCWATRSLHEFTILDLREYQKHRSQQVANRMVNLELRLLRNLLQDANLWGKFAGKYKPLREAKSLIGRPITIAEERRLLDVLFNDPAWNHVGHMANLALNGGFRGKDLKTLSLGKMYIDGEKAAVEVGSKSEAGRRRVPLNQPALISAWALRHRAFLLGATEPHHFLLPANLSKHTKPDDPMFGRRGLDPADYQRSIKTVWNQATAKAGLPGLRFHDLRHTFITRQAERGTPVYVTMAIVGHMSEELVRYYTHISDTSMRAAVDALDPLALQAVTTRKQ